MHLWVCLVVTLSAPLVVDTPAVAVDRVVALTFDDGPRPAVLRDLLPLLRHHNVPASFFVIGGVAEVYSEAVRRIAAEGHAVENHSYAHRNIVVLSRKEGEDAVLDDIERASEVIENIVGQHPRFFRPPYWEITPPLVASIRRRGYTVLQFGNPDVNTLDYDDVHHHRPADTLVVRVERVIERRERSGRYAHVLVFHELHLSIDALSTLIPWLKRRGYRFVGLNALK